MSTNRPRTVCPLGEKVKAYERDLIVAALQATGGSMTAAGELLGITRKNMWQKCQLHGINRREAK